MQSNVIIKGFNALQKLITRGYGKFTPYGISVKFCRVYTKPFVDQKAYTNPFISQKVSTK